MSRPKPSKLIHTTFADRLKIAADGMTATELSRRLKETLDVDLSYQAISNYIEGQSLPKSDVLYALSKCLGRPMEWFFGDSMGRELDPSQPTQFEEQHAFIPLYDVQAAAGLAGIVSGAFPQVLDVLPFKRSWLLKKGYPDPDKARNRLALIRARGDSMEPTISDGEVLLVDLDDSQRLPEAIRNGAVYVLRWGFNWDGWSVKRVHYDRTAQTIMAASDNPLWPAKELQLQEGRTLQDYILGRVIWVGKENI